MQRSRMSPYETLIRAVPLARRSPMVTGFKPGHPRLKLAGFIALAALFLLLTMLTLHLVARLVPGLTAPLGMPAPFPDTTNRLINESALPVVLAAILGSLALAVLAAACIAYGRRATDFLWPGRRFNAWDLGVGFLSMACVSAILFPVYFWLGGPWTPPILNPIYADWTRVVFLGACLVGLLIAAAGEEIVFRGVLLRLTGQISIHPVVLCVINGVLFSALHMDPDPVAFVARSLSGAVWTWAAIRLGGLEFVIGAHLAKNLMIVVFLQPMSAMLETGREASWTMLAPELFVAVMMLIVTEQLADGPRDWMPARSAPRGAA